MLAARFATLLALVVASTASTASTMDDGTEAFLSAYVGDPKWDDPALYLPEGCTCDFCNAKLIDPSTLGYCDLLTPGKGGSVFRKVVLPCGKVLIPQFVCPEAPADLRAPSSYMPSCCGIILDDAVEMCKKCGWKANILGLCPADERDKSLTDVLVYGPSQRGREKIPGEDVDEKTTFQTVPLVTPMKIGDILSAVEESAPDYLKHHFEVTMQATTTRSIDYVMDENTVKVEADFTAQVEHNHDGNLTCCKPNHSNCEVVVVHLNPRMLAGKDGVHRRVVDVHVWYGIGPTASKHKEADSHFHNAYLAHIIDYYKANLHKFVDAPGAELKNVFVCSDGCRGQYKGRFNFKYLAEYAKDFGVKVMHIFPPTAHGKGYVDALGQTPGRLLNHEEKMKRRIKTAYELFKLVRGKRGGVVPESERGKGRFAVNGYYVNYLTSDPEDPHLDNDDVIYIDRSTKWNVCGLPGSNEMYFFAGLDPTDDEHILAKPFFCVCEACRVTEFHKCKATEWTGHHTTHSIRYTDTPRATFKRAEVLGAFTAFADSVSDGDALVFAIEEDDGHPYGIAIADGPPFKADRVLKTGADGVSQKIITGEWCARIKFWLQRDAEDPLKFTRADVLDDPGRIAATVFSFENMQLTPKVSLRCDSSDSPDVYFLPEADHDALLQKNWSRFQRRF